MKNPQCCERVWSGDMRRFYPCSRQGKNQRDGKWYCTQHDPATKKAKDDAKREATIKRREAKEKRREEALNRVAAIGLGSPELARDWEYGYTGGVTLSPEECDALIARLEGKP